MLCLAQLDTDPSADRGALQATIEFQASRLADLKATHGGGVDDYGDDDDDDDGDDYAAGTFRAHGFACNTDTPLPPSLSLLPSDLAARAARPAPTTLTREQIREMFDYYANFGRSSKAWTIAPSDSVTLTHLLWFGTQPDAMGFQDTIDSFMFMKFAKECPDLLDGHRLTRTGM